MKGKAAVSLLNFKLIKVERKLHLIPKSARASTSKITHLSSVHVVSVPGNFHVSTHSADTQPDDPNMSHYINSLVMGDDIISDKQVRIHETRRNMK